MKSKEKNDFSNSFGFKRYYTQDFYLKKTFGIKVFKVPLSAGFTCPNRDGSKGNGGCTFCSALGSGDFAGDGAESLEMQFHTIKEKLHQKWKNASYIAYFQSYSNTYAPAARVRAMLERASRLDGVLGISIATRPDCIDEEMADLLQEFSQKMWFEVELGLQSVHDTTAELINRCHTVEEFSTGYALLKSRNIPVCIHIINGLPHESKKMMMETASFVANLHPHSVKIHMLHLIAGSKMAMDWQNTAFALLTVEQYVEIVCDQIEILPPDVVIQRVTGDGDSEFLIAPAWTRKKFVVINNIDKEFIARKSHQGIKYTMRNDI